jgi:hypothetical protein
MHVDSNQTQIWQLLQGNSYRATATGHQPLFDELVQELNCAYSI